MDLYTVARLGGRWGTYRTRRAATSAWRSQDTVDRWEEGALPGYRRSGRPDGWDRCTQLPTVGNASLLASPAVRAPRAPHSLYHPHASFTFAKTLPVYHWPPLVFGAAFGRSKVPAWHVSGWSSHSQIPPHRSTFCECYYGMEYRYPWTWILEWFCKKRNSCGQILLSNA